MTGAPAGALVVVGTPIGNLGDLAPRAVAALTTADVICCADARKAGRLLRLAGIDTPELIEVGEASDPAPVMRLLDAGRRVAAIGDGGMPGIADPGERLVRAALDAGHAVEVVPGPSAPIAALVASGLPAGRFVFEGYLPRKGPGRTERLAAVAVEQRTVVLCETPHRLAGTLADLVEACGGDRAAAVAEELTKQHEDVWRGDLRDAADWAAGREPAGEVMVVLGGAAPPAEADDDAVGAAVAAALAEGLSVRDAAAKVSRELGIARRRAYEEAVARNRR